MLKSKQRKRRYKNIIVDKSFTVLDCGAWDLAYHNLSYYIVHLNNVLRNMSQMQKNNVEEYPEIFRNPIFWQTVPAFRNYHKNIMYKGNRNNFAIAALNAWAKQKVEHMGINVVDIFQLSLGMEDSMICDDHYLCYNGTSKDKKIYGTIGITAAQLILDRLCS